MIVEQPDLFGGQRVSNQRPGGLLAHSRSSDPRSSKDAAASVNGNRQMRAILDALRASEAGSWWAQGPRGLEASITADSTYLRMLVPGVERNAWSSRLSAMEAKGLLEAAGEVPGRYGRPVRAFRLTKAGRAAAEGLRGAA